jgi:hypothetical protein
MQSTVIQIVNNMRLWATLINEAAHLEEAEDYESNLPPRYLGFPREKLPGHERGLRLAGQPHLAFHEMVDEQKIVCLPKYRAVKRLFGDLKLKMYSPGTLF